MNTANPYVAPRSSANASNTKSLQRLGWSRCVYLPIFALGSLAGFVAAFSIEGGPLVAVQEVASQPTMLAINVAMFAACGLVQWLLMQYLCCYNKMSRLVMRAAICGFMLALLIVAMNDVLVFFKWLGLPITSPNPAISVYTVFGVVLVVTSLLEILVATLMRKRGITM